MKSPCEKIPERVEDNSDGHRQVGVHLQSLHKSARAFRNPVFKARRHSSRAGQIGAAFRQPERPFSVRPITIKLDDSLPRPMPQGVADNRVARGLQPSAFPASSCRRSSSARRGIKAPPIRIPTTASAIANSTSVAPRPLQAWLEKVETGMRGVSRGFGCDSISYDSPLTRAPNAQSRRCSTKHRHCVVPPLRIPVLLHRHSA